MKSDNFSNERTQTTDLQNNDTENKNLILNKRSRSNVNELHILLDDKSKTNDSDSSNFSCKNEDKGTLKDVI